MHVDDIFTYDRLVAEEKANLQKGMNFGIGGNYSLVRRVSERLVNEERSHDER